MIKKSSFILFVSLGLFLVNQVWADTIDEITVSEEEPYTVEINGTYDDACDRDAVLLTTSIEDEIIIQIFTDPLPTEGDCLNEPGETFSFSQGIIPPGKDYDLMVILYQGKPGIDDEVSISDSVIIEIGDDDEEPPATELEAEVDVIPDTINMKRQGRFVGAKINVSEGYSVEDIDTETITMTIVTDDGVLEDFVEAERTVIDEEILIVKFNNNEIKDLIESAVDGYPIEVTFEISGELSDGSTFTGTDDVDVINPGRPR